MGFSGSSVSENNKIREHYDRWGHFTNNFYGDTMEYTLGCNGMYHHEYGDVWVRAFLGIEDDENHGI